MLAVVLPLLLSAQPTTKLAAVDFSAIDVDRDLARFYSNHLAQRLTQEPGIEVITSQEIAQVLGLERQKQLLGCGDDAASCLTEVAGALGADYLITGMVARTGEALTITVRVLSARNARAVFVRSLRGTEEDELLEKLNDIVGAAAKKLRPAGVVQRPTPPVAVEPPPKPVEPPPVVVVADLPPSQSVTPVAPTTDSLRWQPWAVVGAGAAMAIGGGVALGQASADLMALKTLCPSPCLGGATALDQGVRLRDSGKSWNTTGWVLVGAGATAIVGGVAWALLGGDAKSKVSVLPTASGGVVIWAGQFD